jgi:hypothetical protein
LVFLLSRMLSRLNLKTKPTSAANVLQRKLVSDPQSTDFDYALSFARTGSGPE